MKITSRYRKLEENTFGMISDHFDIAIVGVPEPTV